jgi:hypothetical protein
MAVMVMKYEAARKEALLYEPVFDHIGYAADKYFSTLPPKLILRPTHYGDRPNMGYWPTNGMGVCINLSLGSFIAEAFHVPSRAREIFEEGTGASYTNYSTDNDLFFWKHQRKADDNVDCLINLPNHQSEALRAELKRLYGLDIRYEPRVMNVLRIEVKDAAKLNARLTHGGFPCAKSAGDQDVRTWMITNQPVSVLEAFVEGSLFPRTRVVDRTGTTNHYDLTLDWPVTRHVIAASYLTNAQQEFESKLGLTLAPSRESVEMLVVERVKN